MKKLPALNDFDLIVIGCSAGGFDALSLILPALAPNTCPAVVVAIHLPADGRTVISEVFQAKTRVPVKEAEDKEPILPGRIYFASPGYHLLIEPDRSFSLSVEEPVNFSRPSIDVLFESAGIAYRDRVAGILLTGASADGAAGLRTIQELRGTTIVQDPSQALYPAMPQSALDLARPDSICSLQEIRRFFEGAHHG